MNHPFSLRVSNPEDHDFMLRVYASTREDEMRLVDWDEAQKQAFVQMQFEAQRQHYLITYPQAQYDVIEQEGQSIGRMIVDRSENTILLVDIAILPEYRNAGIGTRLIEDLLEEADRSHCSVQVHVEIFNPAMNLYKRLGFVKTGEISVYHEMTHPPKVRAYA